MIRKNFFKKLFNILSRHNIKVSDENIQKIEESKVDNNLCKDDTASCNNDLESDSDNTTEDEVDSNKLLEREEIISIIKKQNRTLEDYKTLIFKYAGIDEYTNLINSVLLKTLEQSESTCKENNTKFDESEMLIIDYILTISQEIGCQLIRKYNQYFSSKIYTLYSAILSMQDLPTPVRRIVYAQEFVDGVVSVMDKNNPNIDTSSISYELGREILFDKYSSNPHFISNVKKRMLEKCGHQAYAISRINVPASDIFGGVGEGEMLRLEMDDTNDKNYFNTVLQRGTFLLKLVGKDEPIEIPVTVKL